MGSPEVSARIAAMERRIRTLRALVFTLAGAQVLWILLGAAWQEEREARRFTIVDKTGKTRIELKTDDAGAPSIVLYDKHGEERVSLDILNDLYAGVNVFGGRSVATMQASDGAASLLLDGDGPNIRMVTEGGPPPHRYRGIIVADDAVETAAHVVTASDGSGVAILKGGDDPVSMYVDVDGTSGFTVKDEKFDRVNAVVDSNGKTKFQLRDGDGRDVKP